MNMQQMMRQAQKMQKELAKAQEEVATMTCEGSAGGGMVTAVVRGDMTVESLEINPEAVDPDDVEMLQDMVCAAVNEAIRNLNEESARRMSAVTGGMGLPNMGGMGLPGMPGLR